MWIVGTLILFVIGVVLVLVIGWKPRPRPAPPLWDIPGLSGTYSGIVGTLAGFTVASAIFIAGLDGVRASPVFATVIGMLLIAFLILVLIALLYASTPSTREPAADPLIQSLSHVLANMGGCLGLTISWLALVPLLELIGLPALAGTFTWLLLGVALAAGAWVAVFANRLTRASTAACLAIPVLGFALAGFYCLGAARLWPALWPATDAALHFALIAFGVIGLLYLLHLGLLIVHGDAAARPRLLGEAHRIVLACSEVYALVVALLWFAVAMP